MKQAHDPRKVVDMTHIKDVDKPLPAEWKTDISRSTGLSHTVIGSGAATCAL